MKKILITEELNSDALKLIEEDKYMEYTFLDSQKKEDILKAVPKHHALVVRSKTTVDADIITAGENLEVIGRAGVGVDNIDVDTAEQKGILVVNAPEGNLGSVAELTMSLILAISRKLIDADARTKSGDFNRKGLMGQELSNKTIGIVGLGRIGNKVAERALAFSMKVIAFDPYVSKKDVKDSNIELVDFNTLLKESDIISIHTPITKETRGLFSKNEFAQMKKGVIIVNTSRSGIIETGALVEALKSEKVLGAGLDVVEDETKDNPLLKFNSVIVTPHLGASTKEAQKNVGIEIIREIRNVLNKKTPKNPVNSPAIIK